MNSLEWINEQIEECKQSIKQSEIRIDEDKKYPSLVKCHKEQIEELKPILKRLEQIKTILEAWKIVKYKNVEINAINCSPSFEVYHLLFNRKITEEQQLTESDYETIKKALEVKYE